MSKAKQITVSPAASSPVKRKAERAAAMALKRQFKATREKYVPKMIAAYKRILEEHRKGLSDESRYVLDELNLDSWAELADVLSEPFASAQQDAAKKALTQLGVSDKDIFDKVNEDAVAAAKERAASLVGMKIQDGDLVPNPSADMAITESTREGIRNMVTTALTDGDTVDALATKLEDTYVFSDLRAETIARTELARAHVDGTLKAWIGSGVVTGKRSLLGSEHDSDGAEDECDDNEADEVIGLDETFSSGDLGPPYHPNCVCVLVADLEE